MADWLIPLLTLTAMEIVLGIDNIIFIAIVADRLPEKQRAPARRLGLILALGTRLLLLLTLSWLLHLTAPVFRLSDLALPADWFDEKTNEISWRDVILLVGGLFLIAKSTSEIHHKLEGEDDQRAAASAGSFALTLVQIALMDVIFSLDSVITAVGMVESDKVWVMVLAIVLAVGVMLVFAGPVSNFVHRHPTLRMLALSFLILIGVMLVMEGFEKHMDRGYIYFAMAFSLAVELLNLRLRPKTPPVELHGEPHVAPGKRGASAP